MLCILLCLQYSWMQLLSNCIDRYRDILHYLTRPGVRIYGMHPALSTLFFWMQILLYLIYLWMKIL